MIYEFTPTQDLHGYDKPWPAGGGKNKLNKADILQNMFISTDASKIQAIGTGGASCYCKIDGGQTYTVSKMASARFTIATTTDVPAQNVTINAYRVDNSATHLTIPTTASDNYIVVFFYLASADADKTQQQILDTIQVELGSSPTSFAPYSNICPPEGFNIWNPTNAEYVQVYAGYVNSNTRELYLRPVYDEYAGEELVGPWMSSMDEYSEDATPTEGAFVIDFGGELTSYEITAFMLQTLLDSLGIRQHFTDGAGLLNKLMDQAQGRVRSEEELLHLSRPLNVIAIGDQLPAGLTFKPISKDVLPGLPGKFIR